MVKNLHREIEQERNAQTQKDLQYIRWQQRNPNASGYRKRIAKKVYNKTCGGNYNYNIFGGI